MIADRFEEVGSCANCLTENVPVTAVTRNVVRGGTGVVDVVREKVCEPCAEMPSGIAASSEGVALAVCTNIILREIRMLTAPLHRLQKTGTIMPGYPPLERRHREEEEERGI